MGVSDVKRGNSDVKSVRERRGTPRKTGEERREEIVTRLSRMTSPPAIGCRCDVPWPVSWVTTLKKEVH